MAQLLSILFLLTFLLNPSSTAADQCPFASSDCQCTKSTTSGYDYAEIDCQSAALPNLHDTIGKIYSTKILTILSDRVSQIPDNYFSGFSTIDELHLTRSNPSSIPAQFAPRAFQGPKIAAIRFLGLSGLLPPPGPLVDLGRDGLRSLWITQHDTTELTVDMLSQFKNLQDLSISRTMITDLSKDFFTSNLYQLQKLRFSGVGWTEVPSVLDQSAHTSVPTKLTALDLSENRIGNISQNAFYGSLIWGYTNLQSLNLSGNPLSQSILNGQLGEFGVNLRTLILSNVGLRSIPIDLWPSIDRLIDLDLSQNQIKVIQDGDFQNLTNIQRLNLDGNPIDGIAQGAFDGKGRSDYRSISVKRTNFTEVDLLEFATIDLQLTDVYLDECEELRTVVVGSIAKGMKLAPLTVHITSTGLETIDRNLTHLLDVNPSITVDISRNYNLHCDGINWIKAYVDMRRVIADDARCVDYFDETLIDYLNGVTPGTGGTTTNATEYTTTSAHTTKGSANAFSSMALVLATATVVHLLA